MRRSRQLPGKRPDLVLLLLLLLRPLLLLLLRPVLLTAAAAVAEFTVMFTEIRCCGYRIVFLVWLRPRLVLRQGWQNSIPE